MPFLALHNVSKRYPSGASFQTVLSNVNVDIARGSFTAFSGPSGAGKSTLLSILGTIETPSEGSVLFQKQNLTELSSSEVALIRNSEFGFVFQSAHFVPYKTLLENVMLPAHYSQNINEKRCIERAMYLLDLVGLTEHKDKSPSLLSGGEQQRMSFARAMLLQPKVIFADEPTANLDAENSFKLLDLLKAETQRNTTVVLVSHDQDALKYADTVHFMSKERGFGNGQ